MLHGATSNNVRGFDEMTVPRNGPRPGRLRRKNNIVVISLGKSSIKKRSRLRGKVSRERSGQGTSLGGRLKELN